MKGSELTPIFFSERVKYFDYPKILRVDPEGAWMSKIVIDNFNSVGAALERICGSTLAAGRCGERTTSR